MTRSVPCAGYASQYDAVRGMMGQGLSKSAIVDATGLSRDRVAALISKVRAKQPPERVLEALPEAQWSAETTSKAKRLVDTTLGFIAEAMALPEAELRAFAAEWLRAPREIPLKRAVVADQVAVDRDIEEQEQIELGNAECEETQEGPVPGSPGGKGMMAEDQRAGAPEAQDRPDDTAGGNKSAPAPGPVREGDGVTDAGKPVAQAAIPDSPVEPPRQPRALAYANRSGDPTHPEHGARGAEAVASVAKDDATASAQPDPDDIDALPVAKPGTQFRLRSPYGEYLHANERVLTRLPKFFWLGQAADVARVKRRNPKWANLKLVEVSA